MSGLYGTPPVMPYYQPNFMPRPPQRRRPKPKPKQTVKKAAPKPLNEQQKATMAKEIVVKGNTIPLPDMAAPVKQSCRAKIVKTRQGNLDDARGRLNQKELNQLYHQVVVALNSGLGEFAIRHGARESDTRLLIRVNLAPGGQIAGKLFKSHATSLLNPEGASAAAKRREEDPIRLPDEL